MLTSTITNKIIFITGGAGFIGTTLSKILINNNKIVLYDNLSRNALKDTELSNHPNLKFIQGDILDEETLKNTLKKYNPMIVLHMAAIAGIDTTILSPTKTMIINMIGTHNILQALSKLNIISQIERFINFSTSEIFGIKAFKVRETEPSQIQPVGEARWTYSVSKLAGEHLTHAYHKEYGLNSVILRPFNVYGPGQVGEGACHCFIKLALKNEPLEIHGDGTQIRALCYIDDMIQGIVLALEKKEAIGETFNIGNQEGVITIRDLAERIVRIIQSKSPIIYAPKRLADVDLRIPNTQKAEEMLGYRPCFGIDQGLGKTIEWYKNKPND